MRENSEVAIIYPDPAATECCTTSTEDSEDTDSQFPAPCSTLGLTEKPQLFVYSCPDCRTESNPRIDCLNSDLHSAPLKMFELLLVTSLASPSLQCSPQRIWSLLLMVRFERLVEVRVVCRNDALSSMSQQKLAEYGTEMLWDDTAITKETGEFGSFHQLNGAAANLFTAWVKCRWHLTWCLLTLDPFRLGLEMDS